MSSLFYLNNNSWAEVFGRMKLYDVNKKIVAKVRKRGSIYTILNTNDDFILQLTAKNGKFYMSFDASGENIEFELARKNRFSVGLGAGHFVLIPFASIPFGAYYGVSKRGDIFAKRNGLYKYIYIGDECIAKVRIKTNYLHNILNSKSVLEVFTSDTDLAVYAIAIFLVMVDTTLK